jgi:hypothetical protein
MKTVLGRTHFETVIIGYFVGNDLTDNVEAGFSLSPEGELKVPAAGQNGEDSKKDKGVLATLKLALIKNLATARLFAVSWQAIFGSGEHYQLSEVEFARLLKLQEAILKEMASEAGRGNSDLLIVSIPQFHQFSLSYVRDRVNQQNELLRNFAASRERVTFLDLQGAFEIAGYEYLYGVANKHMNRLGHYITARAIAQQLGIEPRALQEAPAETIVPDCSKVDHYAKLFAVQ